MSFKLKAITASCALIVCAACCLSWITWYFCPKPNLKSGQSYSSAYFDKNGQLLRLTLAQDQRYRLHEELAHISPKLIEASLLYEDQNYYQHWGVDFSALVRAFWSTYIRHDRRIGASTIPMQVARLRFGISSHRISGKIEQILRALQLSRHYNKNQLLEAYFNLAPYGGNIEGVAAASLIYFNKRPSELNQIEALTLAVIPQNPNKRNPARASGFKNLLSARSRLFKRWQEQDSTQLNQQNNSDLEKFLNLPLQVRSPSQLPFAAPHFIDYLEQNPLAPSQGYIHTHLDLKAQELLEQILQDYVGSRKATGINNASALLINYQQHSIAAMVGSADFFNQAIQGQVNGTNAKRSPGSTLKPLVYALALDEGLIHPLSLLKDSPQRFGGFTPENYDKRFLGPISASEALISSRNVPAVNLQAQLKNTSLYQLLTQAGVQDLEPESFYGLALALGGGELTALELANLYAMLANGGQYWPLMSLKELNSSGNKGEAKQLLSPEASYLVLDILKNNPRPGAISSSLINQDSDIPWKTGTSWAFRDAWSAGIAGPYVLVVWVGNFDGQGNPALIGRTAAGPLFFRITDALNLISPDSKTTTNLNQAPTSSWRLDKHFPLNKMNLKRLQVCASTGDLNTTNCPATAETWFIPGVSPIKVSNIYRKIAIDKKSGMRACEYQNGQSEYKVFAFWPSDFLEIFQKAGISLATPPAFAADCPLNTTSSSGLIPVITSPQTTLSYVARIQSKDNQIPLQAVVDSDVKTLFWFINDEYIGSVANGELLSWQASPGEYTVRVVDDAARSSSQVFRVFNTSL